MATFSLSRLGNRYLNALYSADASSRALEDEAMGRLRDFDATTAATTASRAAYEDIYDDLAKNIERLRADQVGMGRLRTGFATEDEDELLEDANRALANAIARNALSATSMNLSASNALANYGTAARSRYLDLLAGGLDRAQMEENARKKRRGGIGALVGAGLGTFVFPGIGTELGAVLGGLAGEVF